MRIKPPLAALGLAAVASGFTAPDPLGPKKQPKNLDSKFAGLPLMPRRPKPNSNAIPGKDRVLTECNQKRAAGMQWLFRRSTACIFDIDWTNIDKEVDPDLVESLTDETLSPPAYYSKVLVHGMSPLLVEQAQAEEPSMAALSSLLAGGVSLYDLSMEILNKQQFIDSDQASKNSNLRIADIGCGTGTLTQKLLATHAEQIDHVDAIDASPYKLAKCFKATKADDLSKVSFHHMLGENLNLLKDNSLDRVLLSFVFHELPRGVSRKIMNEAWRVLSPGGSIHIVDMDAKHPRTMNLGPSNVGNWLMEPYMDSFLTLDIEEALLKLNFTDVNRSTLESPAPIAGFTGRKPQSASSISVADPAKPLLPEA